MLPSVKYTMTYTTALHPTTASEQAPDHSGEPPLLQKLELYKKYFFIFISAKFCEMYHELYMALSFLLQNGCMPSIKKIIEYFYL